MPLKYLFVATFEDGSTYVQTQEDKSLTEPETRSQYYDVVELAKKKKLVSFILKGEGREFGVDLRDGHFEINGEPFFMHEEDHLFGFDLIFFRNHTHHFLQGKYEDTETGHEIVYRVGWQCTVGGKNYQHVMQVK